MIIKIGEDSFDLKYNNKALFKIEEILGISVIKLFQNESELEKTKTIYTIVYCGIQEEITFDEFCDEYGINELVKVLPDILTEVVSVFDTGSKKK
jgi:hypothetical protein